MRRTAAAPGLICLALLLSAAGCGGSSQDAGATGSASGSPSTSATGSTSESPSPEGTPSATAAPTSSPGTASGGQPFPADLRPDDGGLGQGNGLGLTGVRVARQAGYDRVVFDLGGTGTPGWRVEYVARPRSDGSGDPVRLRGSVFLQVTLHGLGMPFDTGVPAYGDSSTRVPGTGTRGVAQVAPGAVFEGDQLAFIGLTGSRRPFRVFALTGPTRVVVDIRDR